MSEFLPTKTMNVSREVFRRMKSLIESRIKGKGESIDNILICLAAGGHVLIEDLPGVGKTTLAYCLAKSMRSDFKRLQFTSDLLPTDVTGVSIYDEREKQFVFKKGSIFPTLFWLMKSIERHLRLSPVCWRLWIMAVCRSMAKLTALALRLSCWRLKIR
jgi:MoxR-like ATPase